MNGNYIKGLVSVVIPTYRRSNSLVKAINSVVNQNYSNIEVLVVDDNSKESQDSKFVRSIIDGYKEDSRVKYVSPNRHINGAAARNYGIKEAKGEYIAFLDDDDEWIRNKLSMQVAYLRNNHSVKGVSCLYTIKKQGKVIRMCKPYSNNNIHRKIFSRDIAVFTSTTMFRHEYIVLSGGFNEKLIRHQDLQMLLDFTAAYEFDVINKYLVVINSDSDINHPDVNKLIKIKELFFEICSKHLDLYNESEKKAILSAHYFEIILSAIKEKKIEVVLKYLYKIGIDADSYRNLLLRWKNRRR